jgi:hypothetical protein
MEQKKEDINKQISDLYALLALNPDPQKFQTISQQINDLNEELLNLTKQQSEQQSLNKKIPDPQQQQPPSYTKSKLKMKTYEFIIMIVLLGILGLLSCFATYRIMKSIPHAICGCVFSFVYITLMWLWFGLFTNKKLK